MPDFRQRRTRSAAGPGQPNGLGLAPSLAMKLAVIALDYDGTIAVDGALDPSVREAIGSARQRGIAVILVTGRRLDDLRHVAGALECFDAVVGENGAVLHFPASDRHVAIGHPAPRAVIAEFERRGIRHAAGEIVIEMDAADAPAALDVVRDLQQPLTLAFNRGRLMLLPPGVAKSTGLRQVLHALRLSIHNAIAIGDAENDHDLLDACEVGVAVAWGSAALRAVADEIIEGSGPPAVADYLRRIVTQPRLSAAQMGRRRLWLGRQHSGEPVSLAVRGRTVLIAGEPGTGKSWLAGLLCEQLILQGYSMCIIDPEGDYRSLDGLPGVVTLGGDDPPPFARDLVRALRHPDVSVVVDLSRMPHAQRGEYLRSVLPLLNTLRRKTGLPHKILLDEAHYCLASGNAALIDPQLAGYVFVTYRISSLDASIREARDVVVIVTRETDSHEVETLREMCRPEPDRVMGPDVFRNLGTNEAALLPGSEESHGTVIRFQMAPRLTSHVRHRAKYLDMPVLSDRAFVFRVGGKVGPCARSLKEFIGMMAMLPPAQIEGHLQRHDFSRWLIDVFQDHGLGARIRALEADAGTRPANDIAADVAQAIRARYDTIPALTA
jgi:hydroxymethylpyrimidine pyrophosphatase-like HAD family hydrolase